VKQFHVSETRNAFGKTVKPAAHYTTSETRYV